MRVEFMNEPVKVTYDLEYIIKKFDKQLDRIEKSYHRRFEKLESKLDTIKQYFKH